MNEFTNGQLEDFEAFRKVQADGKYNMLHPLARKETGLSPERYKFTIANYADLKKALQAKEQNK